MDYSKMTDALFRTIAPDTIFGTLEKIRNEKHGYNMRHVCETCFRLLDLTTLDACDTADSVGRWARRVADLRTEHPSVPAPATLCVFPVFVDTVGISLGESDIGITAVAGGFPTGKTYLEVKMLECAMAEENGADEIDIVMNTEAYREENYNLVANEIEIIRTELDEQTILKVILETGLLPGLSDVYNAAVLAMVGGADFVKTSTGKVPVGATPEAVAVMCGAIRDYYRFSGRRVGIKVAGGVRTEEDALLYYSIVRHILGEQWLDPALFRIGASSLADRLIGVIEGTETAYFGNNGSEREGDLGVRERPFNTTNV